MSQQSTYSAVSLYEATGVSALHVTVAQVQSAFLTCRIDRADETDSDNLGFLGRAALSLEDWFSALLRSICAFILKGHADRHIPEDLNFYKHRCYQHNNNNNNNVVCLKPGP